VSDPAVERRARAEVEAADLSDPAAIDGLRYLEGCLEEAMRLWPTTPLLARETAREATLCGERLDEATPVFIVNTFNHRDTDQLPDADRFRPERWAHGADDYRFNHLSHGTQDCPGAPLVRVLGKAVIAGLLQRATFTLRGPRLDVGAPVPHMLDFFAIRLTAAARQRASSPATASEASTPL
jgi:cytochrome P450